MVHIIWLILYDSDSDVDDFVRIDTNAMKRGRQISHYGSLKMEQRC